MSTTERRSKARGPVSLADEEGMKEILSTTVLGLWELVNNLTRITALQARALPGRDLRIRARPAGGTSMLDPRLRMANPEDFQIPRCLDTADEAIAVVRELHVQWVARRPGNC